MRDDTRETVAGLGAVWARAEAQLRAFADRGLDVDAIEAGELPPPRPPATQWTAFLDGLETRLYGEAAAARLEPGEEPVFRHERFSLQMARWCGADDRAAVFHLVLAGSWRQLIGAPSPRLVALLDQLDTSPAFSSDWPRA